MVETLGKGSIAACACSKAVDKEREQKISSPSPVLIKIMQTLERE